jgi:hypothetical protein
MADATPPTLAARNAYALVLVVLMMIFVSQAGGVIDRNVYIEVLFTSRRAVTSSRGTTTTGNRTTRARTRQTPRRTRTDRPGRIKQKRRAVQR